MAAQTGSPNGVLVAGGAGAGARGALPALEYILLFRDEPDKQRDR